MELGNKSIPIHFKTVRKNLIQITIIGELSSGRDKTQAGILQAK